MRFPLAAAALLFAGPFLLFAGPALAYPVTVENCGRTLTFDAAPKRAVVHDIDMSEMAFALHLQPDMAGVTGITGWYKVSPAFKAAQGAVPELAPKYPTLETLVAADADFFFAGWYTATPKESGCVAGVGVIRLADGWRDPHA